MNKYQEMNSILENNLTFLKSLSKERDLDVRTSIKIDRESVDGKHILSYSIIHEVPANEEIYFPPFAVDNKKQVPSIDQRTCKK